MAVSILGRLFTGCDCAADSLLPPHTVEAGQRQSDSEQRFIKQRMKELS